MPHIRPTINKVASAVQFVTPEVPALRPVNKIRSRKPTRPARTRRRSVPDDIVIEALSLTCPDIRLITCTAGPEHNRINSNRRGATRLEGLYPGHTLVSNGPHLTIVWPRYITTQRRDRKASRSFSYVLDAGAVRDVRVAKASGRPVFVITPANIYAVDTVRVSKTPLPSYARHGIDWFTLSIPDDLRSSGGVQ